MTYINRFRSSGKLRLDVLFNHSPSDTMSLSRILGSSATALSERQTEHNCPPRRRHFWQVRLAKHAAVEHTNNGTVTKLYRAFVMSGFANRQTHVSCKRELGCASRMNLLQNRIYSRSYIYFISAANHKIQFACEGHKRSQISDAGVMLSVHALCLYTRCTCPLSVHALYMHSVYTHCTRTVCTRTLSGGYELPQIPSTSSNLITFTLEQATKTRTATRGTALLVL